MFHYHLKVLGEEKEIELRFNLENFCHLLGIESIVRNSVPFKELHNYRGISGWNHVKDLSIDIPHISHKKSKIARLQY